MNPMKAWRTTQRESEQQKQPPSVERAPQQPPRSHVGEEYVWQLVVDAEAGIPLPDELDAATAEAVLELRMKRTPPTRVTPTADGNNAVQWREWQRRQLPEDYARFLQQRNEERRQRRQEAQRLRWGKQ